MAANGPPNEPPAQNQSQNENILNQDPLITDFAAGTVLPPFASDENKVLQAQVEIQEKMLRNIVDELENHTERVDLLQKHLKNVDLEKTHAQSMLEVAKQDVNTEQHLKQLASREEARLTQSVQRLKTIIDKAQDFINSAARKKFAANEKLEQFKQQMNWNAEELMQWTLAAKQKADDRAALELYEKKDNALQKKLMMRVEKLSRTQADHRANLLREEAETQSMQIELDKVAEEYKKLFNDKQALIQQWNESVQAMQRREQDIEHVSEQIASGKADIRERGLRLTDQQNFLNEEKSNNKQLNLKISEAERIVEKKRLELIESTQSVTEFENQVGILRSQLEKAESELRTANQMNQNLEENKIIRQKKLDVLKEEAASAHQQLNNENQHTDRLHDRARKVEEMFKQTQKSLKNVIRELQSMKDAMFKHSQELFDKRKQEADLIAEISGTQGSSRNLEARIHELDQRSLKQQEMLYNIEFQVQQLERQVSHASGKRTLEETMMLNAQINTLQEQMQAQQSAHSTIASQVKRLNDEMRAAKRSYQSTLVERDALTSRIESIELENDSVSQELRELVKRTEERIVSHDVMKLDVKRLRENLNERVEQVVALEKRRVQLQLSMKERDKELEVHSEMQRAEAKSVEESRHSLAMELNERNLKVEKLARKYETISAKLPAEEKEEKSQAYYIIQAAQEREELQREGEALNKEIEQREREIEALMNTQQLLVGRNAIYRAGFAKADMSGEDAKQKEELEIQNRAALEKFYKSKKYLRELSVEFEERRHILANLVNSIGATQSQMFAKENQNRVISKSLTDQENALQRATAHCQGRRNAYRQRAGVTGDDVTDDELSIELQEQRRKYRMIATLVKNFIEKQQQEYAEFTEAGIDLDRPVSAASSALPGTSRPGTGASSRRPSSGASRPLSGNIRRLSRTSLARNGSGASMARDGSGASLGRNSSGASIAREGNSNGLPPIVGISAVDRSKPSSASSAKRR